MAFAASSSSSSLACCVSSASSVPSSSSSSSSSSALHASARFSLGRPRLLLAKGPVAACRVQTCCIRCCASHEEKGGGGEGGGGGGVQNSSARNSRAPHPSWTENAFSPQSFSASSSFEQYGGWSPIDPDASASWKAGLLRVGAGFVLALGISLVSYLVYTKQGRRLETAPTATQEQQTSSSTKLHLSHDYNEDEETSHELADKNANGDLREDDNHDMQKDREQGVQIPEQEPGMESAAEVHKKKVDVAPVSPLTGNNVVVPAAVDPMQSQVLAALQALQVIEPGVEPGAICTRRDYARWLIAVSSTLARSTAKRVFPAMYIEDLTELGFNDVTPDDPDFTSIQGLAEAGLIPSNLSQRDAEYKTGTPHSETACLFYPDSSLSRQDLVSWKIALDQHTLPATDKEAFRVQSGFIDVDQIDERSWSALSHDLLAGETSIAASAFGFTRLLQPNKATTNGQAVLALASGDASGLVSEELTRLQAEAMAEEAVAAHHAMEVCARDEFKSILDAELFSEKQHREHLDEFVSEVKAELEKVEAEKELVKDSLRKDRTTVDAELEHLHQLRQQIDEQLQALSADQVAVSVHKTNLEKLRMQAEEEKQQISNIKSEISVEKKALLLARLWAEREAERAFGHGKILEESRKRWANRGIEVVVDTDLDEDNVPGPSWFYSGSDTELNKFLQRAPLHDDMARGEDLKSRIANAMVESRHTTERTLSSLRQKFQGILDEIWRRKEHLRQKSTSSGGQKVQDTRSSTDQVTKGLLTSVVEQRTKGFADNNRWEANKLP